MLIVEMPNVPGLHFAADVAEGASGSLSATSVAATPDEAGARCRAEMAERRALDQWRSSKPRREDALGSAAALSRQQATSHAVLELGERLICLKWWRGDHRAAAPSTADAATFEQLRTKWPRKRERRTGLIDLTPAAHQPVFAVWSCEEDGFGFCIGTAAGITSTHAITSALLELYQMEFGLEIIRHRREHGVRLGATEVRQVNRAEGLNVAELEDLLHPTRRRSPGAPSPGQGFGQTPSLQSLPSPDPALHVMLALHAADPDAAKTPERLPAWALY